MEPQVRFPDQDTLTGPLDEFTVKACVSQRGRKKSSQHLGFEEMSADEKEVRSGVRFLHGRGAARLLRQPLQFLCPPNMPSSGSCSPQGAQHSFSSFAGRTPAEGITVEDNENPMELFVLDLLHFSVDLITGCERTAI